MRTNRLSVLAALLLANALLPVGAAEARKLFVTGVTVEGGAQGFAGTNNALDVPDLYTGDSLGSIIPGGFDPLTQSMSAALDLRGLAAQLDWIPSGGGTLRFSISGIVSVEFTAANYEEALREFEKWLEGDFEDPQAPGSVLTALLQGLVRESPVDPVAGNPNSLQSRMLSWDYRLGSEGPFTSGEEGLEPATNLIGAGVEYGHFEGGPFAGDVVELPLDYRFNFANPRWSLLMNAPIAATFTEGQWSVLVSGALGVQFRPRDWWALTPLVRVGGVGSLDVGALAVLYGATLTNHMRLFEWRGVTLAIGNMGGFTKTVDGIEVFGHEITYDLTNPMTRNGGDLSGQLPVDLFGAPIGWKIFGSNMLLFGDDLFAESQSEVGAQLSTLGAIGEKPFEALGLSASYVFAEDYDAVSLRLRWRF